MAKYIGIPPFTGTQNLVCIYKMGTKYYIRKPSSLTGERVKTDPRFKNTMKHADYIKKASPIASRVYALIPAAIKVHALFLKLTGEATQWLKYHWNEADILQFLLKKYAAAPVYTPSLVDTTPRQSAPTRRFNDWQPLTHRKSAKAFVLNMLEGNHSKKIRQYERYLGLKSNPECIGTSR